MDAIKRNLVKKMGGDALESLITHISKKTGVGEAISGAKMGAKAGFHSARRKRKAEEETSAREKKERHAQRGAEVMGEMSHQFSPAPQHHAPPPQQQYHHQPQQHQYHQPQQNRSWPTLRPAPGRMMMSDRNTSQEYINRLREATLKEFTLFDLGLAGGALGTAGIMGWKAKKYWDKRKKKNTNASINASINTGFDGRLTKLEQDVKAPVFPRLKQEARDEYGRLKAVGAQKIAGAADRVGDHFRGGAKRESHLTDQAFLNLREGFFSKPEEQPKKTWALQKVQSLLGPERVEKVEDIAKRGGLVGILKSKIKQHPKKALAVTAAITALTAANRHRSKQARLAGMKSLFTTENTHNFKQSADIERGLLREGFFSRAQPKKEEPPKAPSKKDCIVSALKRHKGKIALAAGVGLGWQGLKAGSRHVKNHHTNSVAQLELMKSSDPEMAEKYRPAVEGSLKFKTGKWLKDFAAKYRGAK